MVKIALSWSVLLCSVFITASISSFSQSNLDPTIGLKKSNRAILEKDFEIGKVTNLFFNQDVNHKAAESERDTLIPDIFLMDECSNTLVIFTVPEANGGGYVSGPNGYGDLEKAQRFHYDESENFTIEEIHAFFSNIDLAGDGQVKIKIYSVDNVTNGPDNLLGMSLPLKVSELVLADQMLTPTIFTFAAPIEMTDEDFFVSLDISALYQSNDEINIWMTDEDCGNGEDTWELWSDGSTWVPYNHNSSWGFESNLLIFCVVGTGNGPDEGSSATSSLLVETIDGPAIIGSSNSGVGVIGNSNNASSFDFDAQGAGIDYGSTSSRRWKTNIRKIENPIDKLVRLRGVYFNWNKTHGGHHDIGFIAEEVGEVIPEIVGYESNGIDATGLDYSKITPLLVEAFNEMYKNFMSQLQQQEIKIQELKQLLADLKSVAITSPSAKSSFEE